MKRGNMYARRVAVPTRKAGRALMDMDEAYARKIGGKNPNMFRDASVRDFTGVKYEEKREDGTPKSKVDKLADRVVTGGMLATNLGYRYGLPSAGVTLAGKALMDLTQSYQTSGTIEP